MTAATPQISVVIASDNHPPSPEKVIGGFFAQTASPADFEVIYIDIKDRSGFRAALERYQQQPTGPHFLYRILPGASRAQCNNAALKLARADTILFFADDFIPSPSLVAAHLQFHRANPAVTRVGVGAGLLPAGKQRPYFYSWLEESGILFGVPMHADMTDIPAHFFYVANSSVKRELLARCGEFDERFPYACWDDFDMAQRLLQQGMTTGFVRDAIAEHDHLVTLKGRAAAIVESGYSAYLYREKFPHKTLGCYKTLEHTPLFFVWRSLRKGAKYLLTRRREHLSGYYKAVLDWHFLQGYRRAVSELG